MFELSGLRVSRGKKKIIEGVDLPVLSPGELLLITGPNGVGKSTLLQSLMGVGELLSSANMFSLDGLKISELSPQERFEKGIFLMYQNPPEIEGVTIVELCKHLVTALSLSEVLSRLDEGLEMLELPQEFRSKYVHAGLSGGQKKLVELLQAWMIKPKLLLVDEVDSGLDSTKQKLAANMLSSLRLSGSTIIAVSHSEQFGLLLSPTCTLAMTPLAL